VAGLAPGCAAAGATWWVESLAKSGPGLGTRQLRMAGLAGRLGQLAELGGRVPKVLADWE